MGAWLAAAPGSGAWRGCSRLGACGWRAVAAECRACHLPVLLPAALLGAAAADLCSAAAGPRPGRCQDAAGRGEGSRVSQRIQASCSSSSLVSASSCRLGRRLRGQETPRQSRMLLRATMTAHRTTMNTSFQAWWLPGASRPWCQGAPSAIHAPKENGSLPALMAWPRPSRRSATRPARARRLHVDGPVSTFTSAPAGAGRQGSVASSSNLALRLVWTVRRLEPMSPRALGSSAQTPAQSACSTTAASPFDAASTAASSMLKGIHSHSLPQALSAVRMPQAHPYRCTSSSRHLPCSANPAQGHVA
mmetsp:Transcript_101106/g.326334  ORF Transcript_101106/g.326334 Transcript_101106/m.326334 type:complete len:305 (+) Transcript_101106:443-1357(+)